MILVFYKKRGSRKWETPLATPEERERKNERRELSNNSNITKEGTV